MPTQSQPMRPRVLVVDDSAVNRKTVRLMLGAENFEVEDADNGQSAIEAALENPPDVILLDLLMPEMDGVQVCEKLKANPKTKLIPVIFLTASASRNDPVKAFQAGASDYVVKPFNEAELVARVRSQLDLLDAQRALLESNERLKELNEEKKEFMRIAAHDLKDPIGSIVMLSELMIDEPEHPQEDKEKWLRMILHSSRKIVSLVNNLLNINELEKGEKPSHITLCDAASLLKEAATKREPEAAAKDQRIELEIGEGLPAFEADANFVAQILDNLISNAIKFTPKGKAVHARALQDKEWALYEIEDEGPGFRKEDMDRLFMKFQRLSAKPTDSESSVGLGLSIAKKMTAALGGEIWCASKPGESGRFRVRFPAASKIGEPR